MVSLGPARGHRHTAHSGFAFRHTSDRESMQSEDVDLLTESTCITPVINNRNQFFCLYLPWIAGFEALLVVVFEILIFVFANVLSLNQLGGKGPPFSFLALLHVLLWLVVMTFHFLLGLQHKQLQLRGYLNFCRSTMTLRLVPPLILSFGNAMLLAFFAIMDRAWAETTFRYYYFLQVVYSLEFLVIFPTLIYYIVKVVKFQRERSLPDCYTIANNNFQMELEGEVGYRCVCKLDCCHAQCKKPCNNTYDVDSCPRVNGVMYFRNFIFEEFLKKPNKCQHVSKPIKKKQAKFEEFGFEKAKSSNPG